MRPICGRFCYIPGDFYIWIRHCCCLKDTDTPIMSPVNDLCSRKSCFVAIRSYSSITLQSVPPEFYVVQRILLYSPYHHRTSSACPALCNKSSIFYLNKIKILLTEPSHLFATEIINSLGYSSLLPIFKPFQQIFYSDYYSRSKYEKKLSIFVFLCVSRSSGGDIKFFSMRYSIMCVFLATTRGPS